MFQARALLAAVVLTVTVPSVSEARFYPCWMVRWYVHNHSREEVEAMARKHRATAKERAAAIACLKDNK